MRLSIRLLVQLLDHTMPHVLCCHVKSYYVENQASFGWSTATCAFKQKINLCALSEANSAVCVCVRGFLFYRNSVKIFCWWNPILLRARRPWRLGYYYRSVTVYRLNWLCFLQLKYRYMYTDVVTNELHVTTAPPCGVSGEPALHRDRCLMWNGHAECDVSLEIHIL